VNGARLGGFPPIDSAVTVDTATPLQAEQVVVASFPILTHRERDIVLDDAARAIRFPAHRWLMNAYRELHTRRERAEHPEKLAQALAQLGCPEPSHHVRYAAELWRRNATAGSIDRWVAVLEERALRELVAARLAEAAHDLLEPHADLRLVARAIAAWIPRVLGTSATVTPAHRRPVATTREAS
jgi:hypothetical protein